MRPWNANVSVWYFKIRRHGESKEGVHGEYIPMPIPGKRSLSTGNIPALTRLLQAFLSKMGPSIGSNAETMTALLGVFQKVVISKSNDHHAFYLLDSIVEFVPKYGTAQRGRRLTAAWEW